MGRRKGSLNKKTLERMGLDKYKIDRKNSGQNESNDRKNGGKRHRRTKAELIAAGYYNQNDGKKGKINSQNDGKPKVKTKEVKVETKDIPQRGERYYSKKGVTVEDLSDRAIRLAKERGEANWEQDFRNDYERGQKIYYVEINELCHTKELLELYVGTVYSKIIIAWVDRGEAHTIGIEDADKIFKDEKEAKKYYSKVRVKDG